MRGSMIVVVQVLRGGWGRKEEAIKPDKSCIAGERVSWWREESSEGLLAVGPE
jgi:hypothetical protein